jgi:hypothetical protein
MNIIYMTRERRKRRGGGPEREAARAAVGRRNESFRYGAANEPPATIKGELRDYNRGIIRQDSGLPPLKKKGVFRKVKDTLRGLVGMPTKEEERRKKQQKENQKKLQVELQKEHDNKGGRRRTIRKKRRRRRTRRGGGKKKAADKTRKLMKAAKKRSQKKQPPQLLKKLGIQKYQTLNEDNIEWGDTIGTNQTPSQEAASNDDGGNCDRACPHCNMCFPPDDHDCTNEKAQLALLDILYADGDSNDSGEYSEYSESNTSQPAAAANDPKDAARQRSALEDAKAARLADSVNKRRTKEQQKEDDYYRPDPRVNFDVDDYYDDPDLSKGFADILPIGSTIVGHGKRGNKRTYTVLMGPALIPRGFQGKKYFNVGKPHTEEYSDSKQVKKVFLAEEELESEAGIGLPDLQKLIDDYVEENPSAGEQESNQESNQESRKKPKSARKKGGRRRKRRKKRTRRRRGRGPDGNPPAHVGPYVRADDSSLMKKGAYLARLQLAARLALEHKVARDAQLAKNEKYMNELLEFSDDEHKKGGNRRKKRTRRKRSRRKGRRRRRKQRGGFDPVPKFRYTAKAFLNKAAGDEAPKPPKPWW